MAQAQTQIKQQPVKQTAQPVQQAKTTGPESQPGEGKKMAWWIWLIIALVVIAAGVGVYFWLF